MSTTDLTKFGSSKKTVVAVNTLRGADFNPDGRTTKGAVAGLLKEVAAAGNRVLVPIHVSADGFIIDGHRRVTVARELGIDDVDAVVWNDIRRHDTRFGEMFIVLNKPVRKLTPREQLSVALKGGPASPDIARQRDHVQDLLTEGSLTYEKFVEKTAPYQVIDNAERGANFLVQNGAARGDEKRRLAVKLVEYQLDLQQQQDLKLYLTEANREAIARPKRPRFSARRLREALDGNEKLNLGN